MHHSLCSTEIDGTTIADDEDLDLVMPMYNLLEYNYSDTTGSLWFYFKDEANDFNNNIDNSDGFKYFKCQSGLITREQSCSACSKPS